MNKRKCIVLIFFILGMSFLIFPKSAKGLDDIAYTFDDNILIDSSISEFDDTFNIRNSSEYTGNYLGTYSFENEVGLTNTDISFMDTAYADTIEVVSEYLGHSEVLHIVDNTSTGNNYHYIDNPQSYGIVELWLNNALNDDVYYMLIDESNNGICYIRYMSTTSIRIYYDDTYVSVPIIADSWNHVKIEFNCTSDKYSVWINTILELDNQNFVLNHTSITLNKANIYAVGLSDIYIDAIGYSWINSYDDYSYDFNELTSGLEFETIGIYSNWSYSIVNEGIIMVSNDGYTQECLELIDTVDNGFPRLQIPLINTSNSLEIYIRSNNTNQGSFIYFLESYIVITRLSIYFDKFYVYDDIDDNYERDVIDNTWYKINIIWNTTSDTFQVWFNNEFLNTYNFNELATEIDKIEFKTDSIDLDYTFDIDDLIIDTRFFNYSIDDNLFPTIEYNGLMEVDKYEFALSNPNTLNTLNSKTTIGWSLIEYESGLCDIDYSYERTYDRSVQMFVIGSGDGCTLRSYPTSTSNFIDVEYDFQFYLDNEGITLLYFEVLSYQANEILAINVYENGILQYWNGSAFITLRTDITDLTKYHFEFRINYELDLTFFDYYVNSVLIEQYNWSNPESNDYGISKVDLFLLSFGDSSIWRIESVGIYQNGISMCTEYGYATYEAGFDWNTKINNLLYLKANGSFHIGLVEGNYIVGESFTTFRSMRDYYNILDIVNGYDSDNYIVNITFVFTVRYNYFNMTTFKIDGVLLKEGLNEYSLIFEHSGVNTDESYFYVSGNILHFNHIADDSNLEYIQASFNISDVSTTNYAISYRNHIDSNTYGYMRINYTDTSNLIQLSTILTTTRFMLTQNRTIRDFVILITDKDNDVITGLTTGYIYNIELLSILDLTITVITDSLLNMIIPLIIILTPTIIFSERFGKQLIIPFFLLMSLVLTFTGMIPIWLFFIIAFPSVIMVFFKSREVVE